MISKRLWALLIALPGAGFAADAPAPQPLAAEHPAYRAPADPDAPPSLPPEPSGALTLSDALAAALARSPALAAFSWEVRAREAALLQARALPNPELRIELEDFAGSGDLSGTGGAETTLSVSQLLELGGKRERRTERAVLARDLAGWDYEAARLAVATRTAEAFFALLALQERLAVADEQHAVAEEAVRTVESMVRAGAVSPVETARSRVARERAALDRSGLARRVEAARAALASQWGGSEPRFERAAGTFGAAAPPPALELLLPLVEDAPELARFAAELAERRAAVAAAQAERTPDVRVGLGGRHHADGDDGALVAELSLPLPLFDRKRGELLEARYRLRRTESERRLAASTVSATLHAAHQRLLRASDAAALLRERALPEALLAFEGARRAWRVGVLRYVEVLDAQRTWFALRDEEIEALADYHVARTELEGLIGRPLDAVAAPQEPRS
jgi:cobalt-zinc-cadmium efflux system outer membrane protein